MEQKYYNFENKISTNIVKGQIIESDGNVNILPTWSPNGKAFAFLSNRGI